MGFVINPERKYIFEYEIGEGEWVSVTYDFPYSEDMQTKGMRKELKTLSKKESRAIVKRLKKRTEIAKEKGKEVELTDKEFEINQESVNLFYKIVRQSLVDWSGFVLPNGQELPVKDDKGKLIEKNRNAVYEFCKTEEPLFEKITLAYGGEIDQKNLRIGLPQDLNSDGVQTDAQPVTSEESVKSADM